MSKPNPIKYGSLGAIGNGARKMLLGVACHECGEEISYSQTSFHHGHPEIQCPKCQRTGYMIREVREGGRLIWFREAPLAGQNVKVMPAARLG